MSDTSTGNGEDSLADRAIITTLREMWRKETGYGVPGSTWVFVRITSLRPGELYWDDWRLVGWYKNNIYAPIAEKDNTDIHTMLEEECRAGKHEWWVEWGDTHINCCRCKDTDGPAKRVADWAKPV